MITAIQNDMRLPQDLSITDISPTCWVPQIFPAVLTRIPRRFLFDRFRFPNQATITKGKNRFNKTKETNSRDRDKMESSVLPLGVSNIFQLLSIDPNFQSIQNARFTFTNYKLCWKKIWLRQNVISCNCLFECIHSSLLIVDAAGDFSEEWKLITPLK